MTCVRMVPRLKNSRDGYEKLDKCQLEKVVVVKNEKNTDRTVKSARYTDVVSNGKSFTGKNLVK